MIDICCLFAESDGVELEDKAGCEFKVKGCGRGVF